MAEYQES